MADAVVAGHEVSLPSFITQPGQTDVLFVVVAVFVVALIFGIGLIYFRLHALPEQMAHDSHRGQYQLVAILALLALFTHNAIFWILALLLAAIQLPDFLAPVQSIASSLARLARSADPEGEPKPESDEV
ncbi:hypothetical protein [Tropicimonas sp. IMCC34043]|uniref:hypothetical protein n=1 Tax=Tropicimonas sp. IMCC34043 TaxID=2248760 RepID=UPI000E2730A5|nr:hypothetical protein [Tropicimonas sp. IMCC34043]